MIMKRIHNRNILSGIASLIMIIAVFIRLHTQIHAKGSGTGC